MDEGWGRKEGRNTSQKRRCRQQTEMALTVSLRKSAQTRAWKDQSQSSGGRWAVCLATAEVHKRRKGRGRFHHAGRGGAEGVSQLLDTCLVIYSHSIYPVPIFARPCSYL